jgi:adenine deaminase
MERAKGIEPSCAVWKTAVLPLNYARIRPNYNARACLVNPPPLSSRVNSLLLTGGRVIDPANHFDSIADVLIQRKNFRRRQKAFRAKGIEIFDATGKIVSPG